jgi:hypothetical protein
MTHAAVEESVDQGQPILLFEWSISPRYFCYTTADEPITFLGRVFTPLYLETGTITAAVNGGNSQLDVTLPMNAPIAMLWSGTTPTEPVKLVLYRKHRNETQYAIRYRGIVTDTDRNSNHEIVLTHISNMGSMKRQGLPVILQLDCGHALYDGGCKVNPLDHERIDEVSTVDGVTITIDQLVVDLVPDHDFSGGYLTYEHPTSGSIEKKYILSQLAEVLILHEQAPGLTATMEVKVYPGCDGSRPRCKIRFNNLDNNDGCPYLTEKDLFNGDEIVV